ncbi:cysteine hydrolase [Romeria aff. gracilis LEGE 07310]|uniref:Cysteine hydrolase n=1 Tax=Vasconcelosia minhoensis LEGE 07310 TaxID=915328 RepID=A0A8J7ACR4_9CYAN|nr:isochorismatase family cysteine hydrolase [Romeria gracilis]MBE9077771.1 cysteine hydrolase [Romeria aff. gracilis LEGE 07310]
MVSAFDVSATALLIVDFQADNFDDGPLPIVGSAQVLPLAKKTLAAARAAGMPIIHTKEVHRKEMVDFGRELDGTEPVHCLESWPGTDFHSDFYPRDGEFTIAKRRYSAFFATDLDLLLRGLGVKMLVIMGSLTNVCIHYTAVDAHQHDYHFFVIEDCCMGSDWEAHWAALKSMEYLQRESRLIHQEFIEALSASSQAVAASASIPS